MSFPQIETCDADEMASLAYTKVRHVELSSPPVAYCLVLELLFAGGARHRGPPVTGAGRRGEED